MPTRRSSYLLKALPALLTLFWALPAGAAPDEEERVQYLRNLRVESHELVAVVVCIGCSVHVGGRTVEVVVIGGSLVVEGSVEGNTVVVGGGVRLMGTGRVAGELTVLGGGIERSPAAEVPADTTVQPYFFLPGQRELNGKGLLSLAGACLATVLLAGAVFRPRRLANMAGALRRHFLLTPLVGLLLATGLIYGFDLAEYLGRWEDWATAALGVLLWVMVGVGYAVLSQALGGVFVRREQAWRGLLAGAMAVMILLAIPVAGFFLFMLLLPLGGGTLLCSGFGHSPDWCRELFRRRHTATT